MAKYKCPAAAQNIAAHRDFVTTFTSFRHEFDRDGATAHRAVRTEIELMRWLTQPHQAHGHPAGRLRRCRLTGESGSIGGHGSALIDRRAVPALAAPVAGIADHALAKGLRVAALCHRTPNWDCRRPSQVKKYTSFCSGFFVLPT